MKQPLPRRPKKLAPLEKAVLCARVAEEHKAESLLVYHVSDIVSYADYIVICSGRSTRHVQSIAEHIEASLWQRRIKSMGVEGLPDGHWILMDYDEVIVHIFYQPVRTFYDLEGLWWEARQRDFSNMQSET